jgi:hypothetical protein
MRAELLDAVEQVAASNETRRAFYEYEGGADQ